MVASMALAVAVFVGAGARAEGGSLAVIPGRGLPAVEAVSVYRAKGAGGGRELAAEAKSVEKPLALPDAGPFEVWVTFKGGQAVRAAETLSVKAGATHELKLGDVFGAVEVFGDNFPRASKVVLTDPRDPGPGEKGHVAVQAASDYRIDLCAPPGVYAVWVVPANGAKAQRVVDNVRIQAGRSVRVGD